METKGEVTLAGALVEVPMLTEEEAPKVVDGEAAEERTGKSSTFSGQNRMESRSSNSSDISISGNTFLVLSNLLPS